MSRTQSGKTQNRLGARAGEAGMKLCTRCYLSISPPEREATHTHTHTRTRAGDKEPPHTLQTQTSAREPRIVASPGLPASIHLQKLLRGRGGGGGGTQRCCVKELQLTVLEERHKRRRRSGAPSRRGHNVRAHVRRRAHLHVRRSSFFREKLGQGCGSFRGLNFCPCTRTNS